jgi:hypothetical protein
VGGFVFRRCLGREARAVQMPNSPVVCVEQMHHIEACPHHEDHKHKILKWNDK